MNVSALRQIARHWPEVIRTAAYLRQLHLERYPRRVITLADAYWISAALANVQNYLLRRAFNPIADGCLPGLIAGLYKAALGVSGTLLVKCLASWSGDNPSPRISPKAIYLFAEREEALIGDEEVCAGPPDFILRFLEVMLRGDVAEARRAHRIRALIPDPGNYLTYATAMIKMALVKQLVAVSQLATLNRLEAKLSGLPQMAKRLKDWRLRNEPWSSLTRSPNYRSTRWIVEQDVPARRRMLRGMTDLIRQLDAASSSPVPQALFSAVRGEARKSLNPTVTRTLARSVHRSIPPEYQGWLIDLLSHQLTLGRLEVRALHAIAREQSRSLGRDGELTSKRNSPMSRSGEKPSWDFIAREFGMELTIDGKLSRRRATG